MRYVHVRISYVFKALPRAFFLLIRILPLAALGKFLKAKLGRSVNAGIQRNGSVRAGLPHAFFTPH